MFVISASTVALLVALSGSAAAACPSIGAAPRTMNGTAESYANSPGFSLNDQGILQYDYGAHFNNLGNWADPFFDSNYALALYRDWLNTDCEDESLRDNFLHQASWLADVAEMRGDVAVWPYPFADENFDLDAGWVSGIGQSRIAGVLLRAEAISGDPKFHNLAQAALRAYEVPIGDGGVVTMDDEVTWIEEMADPAGRSYKVLNGHITGLAGIWDFYTITGDDKWKTLFDRGIAAVERDISKFDAGFSSYYSLLMPSNERPIAPLRDYNPLHISQLLWLYDLTGKATFLEYASRFQAYEVNDDRFSASSSIDAEAHGPDSVRAKYGSSYWSVGEFPAWFEIETAEPEELSGVAIDMNLLSEAPSSLVVSARVGGDWQQVGELSEVTSRYVDIDFNPPVQADAVRLDIPGHNGDGLVALRSVMILRASPVFAPVANDCNHTSDSRKAVNPNNIDNAFDGDPSTSMSINCDGWIMWEAKSPALIEFLHASEVTAEVSDDLSNWEPIDANMEQSRLSVNSSGRFVRVHFTAAAAGISEVMAAAPSACFSEGETVYTPDGRATIVQSAHCGADPWYEVEAPHDIDGPKRIGGDLLKSAPPAD